MHALTISDVDDCLSPTGAKTMLIKNTRVLDFSVAPVDGASNLYNISIILLHLPDDSTASIDEMVDKPVLNDPKTWHCKSATGNEYCSLSKVSTTVYRRLPVR